jgi:hypothetical protein
VRGQRPVLASENPSLAVERSKDRQYGNFNAHEIERYWNVQVDPGRQKAAVKYRTSKLSLNLDMVLSHYRVSHPLIRYVQVGAFDGVSDYPTYPLIEKHGLQGILVEPQRDAFERLRANYAHFDPTAYVPVNAAICRT